MTEQAKTEVPGCDGELLNAAGKSHVPAVSALVVVIRESRVLAASIDRPDFGYVRASCALAHRSPLAPAVIRPSDLGAALMMQGLGAATSFRVATAVGEHPGDDVAVSIRADIEDGDPRERAENHRTYHGEWQVMKQDPTA